MQIIRNTSYCGDAMQLMQLIPDHSIDMILCDLPYGVTSNKWDTILPLEEMWQIYKRIIKPGAAIVLTAAQPFSSQLVMSNLKNFKYEWIWEKARPTGFLRAKLAPMKIHETILVFCYGGTRYHPQDLIKLDAIKINRRSSRSTNYHCCGLSNPSEFTNYPKDVIRFSNEDRGLHPTQKPVLLFEYLIKTYTNEGDLVLDNCAGCGTTGEAAYNTGREYIQFEKNPEYFDIILEREKGYTGIKSYL